MKEYLVSSSLTQYEHNWIVSAKDSKDAINIVFEKKIVPLNEILKQENELVCSLINTLIQKSNLSARSIGSLHNELGKIITLS